MRAIVQDEYGGPELLRLGEVDRPAPGPGQVLVEVRAAGVDRGAEHLMTGVPLLLRLQYGLRRPKARVRGREASGVVAAVSPGVTTFSVGDEVLGVVEGAFAEQRRNETASTEEPDAGGHAPRVRRAPALHLPADRPELVALWAVGRGHGLAARSRRP